MNITAANIDVTKMFSIPTVLRNKTTWGGQGIKACHCLVQAAFASGSRSTTIAPTTGFIYPYHITNAK